MKTKWNLVQIYLLCVLMLQAFTSSAQPVTKVAAGWSDSFFLKNDGSQWGMGYNGDGQLGDGSINFDDGNFYTNQPEQIVASNVIAIAAGDYHSLFLKNDGSLWAMGGNADGELGNGNYIGTNQPEEIVASNVTAIAAGISESKAYVSEGHSLFLKSDGSLWGMGENTYGQLGDGTSGRSVLTNQPEQIVASNVTAIAAGYGYSLFRKSDGSLWGMGDNVAGELSDGTYNQTNRPEQIVASNVTAIAAGFFHSLFIKSDGSLWAMGDNEFGQLGVGTYITTNRPEQIVASNVTAIAAGFGHSLFIKSDGSLWAMGDNEFGQLGDGTYNSTNRPEQIVASRVKAIAAGYGHSLFVKSDGSLWGMGFNGDGQLGDGTYNFSINQPEQILAAYNQISGQLMGGTNMQLSFVGVANANYALDRASSLSPPNWIPQATNAAGSFGALVFTNAPDATTNNFWRIRSVP
jgi:alpha-tubulin suppressor-like RCC1 family protein